MVWKLMGRTFKSRMLLGTAKYPSPECLRQAIESSKCEIVTVSLRRQSRLGGEAFWNIVRESGATVLPNTAGCRSVKEAVTIAHMARELFQTNWIKLEVVGDEFSLQPDPFALVEAAGILIKEGFDVFPYTTDDIVVNERLVELGCQVLMPWAAPIGSGRGLVNPSGLKAMRARFQEVPLIIDAGIGRPSHAVQAMELGYNAVLLNTAVAEASDPVKMAEAFAAAVFAGRQAFEAGLMTEREMAVPSTPVLGSPFWQV